MSVNETKSLTVNYLVALALFIFICFCAVLSWILPLIVLLTLSPLLFLSDKPDLSIFLWLNSLLYSNLFTALLIYQLDPLATSLLRGLDFILLATLFLHYFTNYKKHRTKYFIFIALIIVYFFVGLVRTGFDAATIYLRMILSFVFLSYIYLNLNNSISTHAIKTITLSLQIFLIFNLLMLLFITPTIDFFNIDEFLSRKYGMTIRADTFFDTRLFNSSYFSGINSFRFFGFTLHPISSGFFFALIFFWFYSSISRYKSAIFFSIISFLLCLSTFSKGSLVTLIATLFFLAVYKATKKKKLTLRLISLYAVLTFITFMAYGIAFKDPHTYSLIGSFNSFLGNPAGGGIGFGGSVFSGEIEVLDFSLVRGDSGLAVIMNMMGVVGLVIYYLITRYTLINTIDFRSSILFILMMIASIYQEEPLSAYAVAGLFLVMIKNKVNTGWQQTKGSI